MSRRKRAQNNTPRAVAIVAVAVLVSIAIAGIVLAQRERAEPGVSTTPQDAVPMTASASSATSAPELPPAHPNEIFFADASDKLPADANGKLIRFAEKARADHKSMLISARLPVSDLSDPQVDLARRRSDAVRNALQTIALQAGGGAAPMVRMQIVRMGSGSGLPAQADHVDLELR